LNNEFFNFNAVVQFCQVSGCARKDQILTTLFRIKIAFLGYRCPLTQSNLASGLVQLQTTSENFMQIKHINVFIA